MRSRMGKALAFWMTIAVCLVVQLGQAGEPVGPATDFQLRIGGDVECPLTINAVDFAELERQTLRVRGHDGRESMFEGVAIVELLRRAVCRSARTCAAIGC